MHILQLEQMHQWHTKRTYTVHALGTDMPHCIPPPSFCTKSTLTSTWILNFCEHQPYNFRIFWVKHPWWFQWAFTVTFSFKWTSTCIKILVSEECIHMQVVSGILSTHIYKPYLLSNTNSWLLIFFWHYSPCTIFTIHSLMRIILDVNLLNLLHC